LPSSAVFSGVRRIGWGSCALRFFFGVTLGRPEAFDRIINAKEPKKLPVV
jgi:hypothetical protein